MFVPQLAHNILSVDALDGKGYSTLFANGIGKVFDRSTRKVILTVPRDTVTRLYTLTQSDFEQAFRLPHQSCLAHSCSNLNPIMRIHYIYGHPSAARTRYPPIPPYTGSDSIETLLHGTLPTHDNNQIEPNSSSITHITTSPRQSTNDQVASNSSSVDVTLPHNNNPINTR